VGRLRAVLVPGESHSPPGVETRRSAGAVRGEPEPVKGSLASVPAIGGTDQPRKSVCGGHIPRLSIQPGARENFPNCKYD
jgi:hypothetical protein